MIAKNRADYVAWAVPVPEEVEYPNGRKYPIVPKIYPYMWRAIDDETDPENPVR